MAAIHLPLRLRRLLMLLVTLGLVLPVGLVAGPAQALPSPPNLKSPPDASLTTADVYPSTGTPTFEWYSVPGADRYTIQICPSAGCASPVLTQETYTTRFTPREALADGTWYWRLRAHVGTEWSDYGSPWSFDKSWLNYGSLAPQLQYPLADATVEFFEWAIFSWDSVPGAAYYRFRIASESSCTTIVYSRDTLKPTHTPAARRSRGDYYWQVLPFDNRNHQGSPSECRHFFMDYQQTPTLLAPADYSTQMFTPEFRWTAVKGGLRYRLEISTVTDFSTLVLAVETPNARYTPQVTLANDKEYYWRVAAIDTTGTYGPWNPTLPNLRRFYMEWHLVPRLLSPTNNYISAPFPTFQWVPVAGARKYRGQASVEPSFGSTKFDTLVSDPRYDHLNWGVIDVGAPYYWRARAEDNRGYVAPWSDTHSFDYSWTPAPTLVYPPFYYDPAVEPGTQPLGVRTDPTIPVPVFMWDRVVHTGGTEVAADSYTIEVDEDFNFTSVDWTTRTQNLSIAPSLESGFSLSGGLYYWRVRAYRSGVPMGPVSEAWPFRFDPALQGYTPTLALFFPADGMDSVYDTPLFGWSPIQGVTQYDFQVSTSPDFGTLVHEAHPLYSFYTPQYRLPPKTYYWRVGVGGNWSETRRFVITYPLRWGDKWSGGEFLLDHPIQNDSYTDVGEDPAGDASGGSPYDLTGLYFARDSSDWYISLDLPYTNTTDMYFVFYVDMDHQAGSGGTTDPAGFNVQAASINLPEAVFFAHHNTAGQIDAAKLYRWSGSSWGPEEDLIVIGGGYSYQRGQYLELRIPVTAFTLGENWIGTVSLEAFTAPAGGQAYDTVPSETAAPTSSLTNFTAVADKPNPLYPWDNPFSNPFVLYTNPPLSFAKPFPSSYVRGYKVQVARDYAFTTIVRQEEWLSGTPPQYWFLGTRWTWQETFPENNTLYWRARAVHAAESGSGPWSQPVRFTKYIYVPQNMSEEYAYTVPTFRWDRVEGAAYYMIQVDDDPEFGNPNISASTDNPSYTPPAALDDGTWHWRVYAYDGSGRASDKPAERSFVKASTAPTLTSPIGGVTVNEVPTFQWQALLDGVMDAPKYRLILDDDPNFTTPYVWSIDLDTTSTTPEASLRLEDGYYWWKVAALDYNNNVGPYSEVGEFYKAYLRPSKVSAYFAPSPDLTWTAVDGAAYYHVQICRDQAYANCVEADVRTDQLNYASPGKYTPGLYYWRVRMCDHAGACGPFYEDSIGPQGLVYMPMLYKHRQVP